MHKIKLNYTDYMEFLRFWESNPEMKQDEAIKMFLHLNNNIPF